MSIHKGSPTKDGRTYYFKKYKDGRDYTSKKYLTKEECEKAESKFILKNDSNVINKRFDLIAEDYFDYLKKNNKYSTYYTYIKPYEKHIYPFFKSFYINKVNISKVREWAENLEKKGYSVKYMNNIYNILNNIFKFACKNYSINYNPVESFGCFKTKNDVVIEDKKKLRTISLEEFNQFVSVIPDTELEYKTLFYMLFYTGMRKGEIQALKWADIDFDRNEITVNKTIFSRTLKNTSITSTKNNTNRIIKISKSLREVLYKYYQEQKKYKDYKDSWFVFGSVRFMPSTNIDRHKHKYFELSGVREITIHEFRHSHVSLLINEYLKSGQTDTAKFFVMMSNRMGHTIEVMQKTYMHLFPTVQDEIVDLLDNL